MPAVRPQETEHPWLTTQEDTRQSSGHAPLSHALASVSGAHALPPEDAATLTARERCFCPDPHVLLHGENAPNGCSTQSVGQAYVLHRFTLASAGHSLPPYCGATLMLRRRNLWPDPHVRLQADHTPKAPTAQSTGHVTRPHACTCVRGGQALPPGRAWAATARARAFTPVPHDTVHFVHLANVVTLQSREHGPRLHVCTSFVGGHTAPLAAREVIARVLIFVPLVPQCCEHEFHFVHAVNTHACAHGATAHTLCSLVDTQTLPPPNGLLRTIRERTLWAICLVSAHIPPLPAPHSPQLPHAPIMQSPGHPNALHSE